MSSNLTFKLGKNLAMYSNFKTERWSLQIKF